MKHSWRTRQSEGFGWALPDYPEDGHHVRAEEHQGGVSLAVAFLLPIMTSPT